MSEKLRAKFLGIHAALRSYSEDRPITNISVRVFHKFSKHCHGIRLVVHVEGT